MTLELILGIVGSIMGSSVLSVLVSGWINKKKVSAESTQVVVQTILEWATKLTVRIDALEAQLIIKEKQIDELQREISSRDLMIKDLQFKVHKLENNGKN